MSKIQIGDYVSIDYLEKHGTVVDDRGGYVGRWKIELDDGSTGYASTRNLTLVRRDEDEEEPPVVQEPVEKIDPEEWSQRSKDSMANILKKYSE